MGRRSYPGGIISGTEPTVTGTIASGMWTLQTAAQKITANTWPNRDVIYVPPVTTTGPIVSNVSVTDSGYNILDDTPYLSTTGGFIRVTGSGFSPGCVVYVGGSSATTTSFISSTEVRAQVGAGSSNFVPVYVVNPDNSTGILLNAVAFSGTPTWLTSETLPEQTSNVAFSIQLSATSDSAVVYNLTAGSSLPTGTTLASSGVISGSVNNLLVDTVYSFSVDAIDLQNQDSRKSFTVNVLTGDIYFNYTTLLVGGDITANTWITDAAVGTRQVTVGGDTKPSNFSPHNPNWSVYFNGASFFDIAANTSFNEFGTGDFTVECWFNCVAADFSSQTPSLISVSTTWSTSVAYQLEVRAGGVVHFFAGDSIPISLNSGATRVALHTWNHVAATRSSGSTRLFVNGANVAIHTGSVNISKPAQSMRIGQFTQGGTQFMTGYISNARVVKGQALYTANFTPSTTTLTTTSQGITSANVLLLCNTNRFIDANTTPRTISSITGVPTANAYSPFAETISSVGSAYFDGTGDHVIVPDNAALELGAGTFCVECWFYTQSISGTGVIIDKRVASGYGPLLLWRVGAFIVVYMSSNNTSWDMINNATIPFTLAINSWYHLALYRIGGTVYGSINGFVYNLGGSAAIPNDNAGNWYIGTETNGSSNPYVGYIADMRFVIGSSVYTTANYAPPSTPLTSITNTQLLLFQNSQGDNNHRFIDETTRKDMVTRVGDVHMGSFTPFSPVGWSANFNGLSDSITVSSGTDFNFSTGEFTIETWVYLRAIPATAYTILEARASDTLGAYQVSITTGTKLDFIYGASRLTSAANVDLGIWNHVAVSRASGNIRLFVNGVVNSTVNYTSAIDTNGTTVIGGGRSGGTSAITGYYFSGYMSNFRVVKGVGVYTGNFTVPTSSLTVTQSAGSVGSNIAAITAGQTVFLGFQQNRFIDSNTTPKTMTYQAGTPRIQPFNPFRPSASYDPVVHGGSARFDGGSDYLYYPPGPTFNFRTFDFTIEAWVYLPANQAVSASIVANNSNPNGWYFNFNASNFLLFSNFSTVHITSTIPVRVGEWTHVAIQRAGTAMTMYFNGLLIASATNSTTYGDPAAVTYVGTNTTGAIFNGFISGLRVIKGQALFTGNFALPTAMPTITQSATTNVAAITTANSVSNVSMLSTFTQAAIYDLTGRNNIQTIATAQVSNVVSKYGGGSLYFPTQPAAFQLYTHPHLTTFTGNFTIECWVYPTSISLVNDWGIIDARQTSGGTPWVINLTQYVAGPPAGWIMQYYNGTNYFGTTRIQANVWTHVAWERVGSTLTLYADGVANGSHTITGIQTGATTNPIYIGTKDNGTGGYGTIGYIDDLRITNGIARYRGSFTVPASKFVNK